jgi:hypothetical protein
MFNVTGCGSALARDTLLVPSALEQLIESAECFVALPLYYILIILFTVILLLVALVRTKIVKANQLKRKKAHASWSTRMFPLATLLASWASVAVLVLLMIIPLLAFPLNNSLIFLIGLQYLCFNILSERLLRKLLRLGAKIISTKELHSSSSDADDTNKTLDYLKRSDSVLRVLHVLIMAGITFQFLCLCVLSMAFPDQSIWLRVGVGMEGFNIFCPMCALIWQYQRCSSAIAKQMNKVKDLGPGSRAGVLDSVLAKFRKHQFILALFGIPGSLLYALLGADVIKISYLVIVVNAFLDAGVNSGVLMTVIKKSNKSATYDTTNLASGSLVMADGTMRVDRSVIQTQVA